MSFNIFDVIEPGSERIIDIDDNDFPVSLALIKKCHDSEDFDLLDLANEADLFTNLANI